VALAASVSIAAGSGADAAACRWRVLLDAPGPQLSAVASLADDDVWAAGDDGAHAFILHWNGRSWRKGRSSIFDFDIDASSVDDV